MRNISYTQVDINGGYLKSMEEQNRRVTMKAVYDRFAETGRIKAFDFDWKPGMPFEPHIFWDSDVAKWMEGAAYILKKHPEDRELEAKVESLIDRIERFQQADGYFNTHFILVEPEKRFTNRGCHELYCAGHLMEAAVAYAEATGRERFLKCMEKYADYINKVFKEDNSAGFRTPGHEEIELALVKMYRYTGKKKYLELAAFFINTRGKDPKDDTDKGAQSNRPTRELEEAEGHCVRAVYLYTAMADIAKEYKDEELFKACKRLYKDITRRKMFITGGIGTTYLGETFTKPYDLPNSESYTETCAGIGLMFFANRMMTLENKADYADTIERVFYNGVLSGLSQSGDRFFYENPLEITMLDHFKNGAGEKRYPITQRPEVFGCSCCPPNLNRLLSSLGNYIFGIDGDTLYVNQFSDCTMKDGDVRCEMKTDYPVSGVVKIKAEGVSKVAVRMPGWCKDFRTSKPYEEKDGYAVMDAEGEITVCLDMTPFAVRANKRVMRDDNKIAIQRGPVVYCAEGVDNGGNLHAFRISKDFKFEEIFEPAYGLYKLKVAAEVLKDRGEEKLYERADEEGPVYEPATLNMIPYRYFANRGETDMLVWFDEE